MATAIPGLSTLGVKFGYAVEQTAGTKPTAFTEIERCNSIGGISIDPENIDASALIDTVTKNVAGRSDTGGTWNVTFNFTNDVETEIETMMTVYTTAKADGKSVWFEVWHPQLTKAFFVVAEPPATIPLPEVGQNDLLTVEINFTIVDYKGLDTAIEPTLGS